jgi:diguanylate cyclase (GGDEF)-like protein
MKLKVSSVRLIILISMIVLTLGSGVAVLASLMPLFSTKVYDSIYEKVDIARSTIEQEFRSRSENTRLAATALSENPEFVEAFINRDYQTIIAVSDVVKEQSTLDFGLFADSEGYVILRTHDAERYGDNVSANPKVQMALAGYIISSITTDEEEPLRISTSVPIFDDDGNILGVVSIGFSLSSASFAFSMKEATGCEITIYDGNSSLASTLRFQSLSGARSHDLANIIGDVLDGGDPYEGSLDFVGSSLLTKMFPIHGIGNEIIGVLLLGIPRSEATDEITRFIFSGAAITLAIFILSVFIAHFVSKGIEKRLDTMTKGIENRDMLLESVNEASLILLGIDDNEDIRTPLISAMEVLGKAMDVDRVHIWHTRAIDDGTRYVREYTWLSDYAKPRSYSIPKYLDTSLERDKLDWMEKFQNNEVISGLIADMPPNYQELLSKLSTKSVTIIPLFLEGQFWGLFTIDSIMEKQEFAEDEITILRSVSLMMATAVRRYLLQLKIKEAHARTLLMLDTSPLCALIFNKELKMIDCNEASVSLYGFEKKQEFMDSFLTTCSPALQPDGQPSDKKLRSLLDRSFEEGVYEFDWMFKIPSDDSPMPAEVTLVRVEYGDDEVIIAYTRDMREIANMEGKILHLENENLKVYFDSLTGIRNRRYFDEGMLRVLTSLSRAGGILSVMMIDVDYFKKYNDTYGHGAGDECLIKVAEILSQSVLRTDDFVARYGGEEFAVVMPNTVKSGALAIADKILENIRECKITHEASEVADHVTVSIGVTTGKVTQFHTPDSFVHKADEMLYLSKKEGRDRCSFGELE